MSEEIRINQNEKANTNFKDIFLKNRRSIVLFSSIILICLFSYFFYVDYKKDIKVKISERYNFTVTDYYKNNQSLALSEMKKIINLKDPTYSPLALYFLLDNNLLNDEDEINKYFDLLINETSLDQEVKHLIIYKKGLYNSDKASEEQLLGIFNPLITKENLWKSHSLYILAEYFFSKNEKQKSKEFFEKILEMENSNPQIKIEAQKRLQRDFGV